MTKSSKAEKSPPVFTGAGGSSFFSSLGGEGGRTMFTPKVAGVCCWFDPENPPNELLLACG